MAKISKWLAGFAFGTALAVSFVPATSVSASPFGGASALRHEQALPRLDVQARRPARRPVRAVKRRNNNAAAAGALIGAAIIGGAIIANSNRRPRNEYYYGAPGYPADYYRRPQPYYGGPTYYQQPQPYYQQPQPYYEAQPYYQAPRRRSREPVYQEPPPGRPIITGRQRFDGPTDVHGNPISRYRDPNFRVDPLAPPVGGGPVPRERGN